MKKTHMDMKSLLVLSALTASASAATITFQGGGDLNSPAAWGGALPTAADIGLVEIDAAYPSTAAANGLAPRGQIIIGSTTATNINLTAAIDIVGEGATSVTFNNVTVTVGDDIFASGNFIFNSGSITSVNDDFEANRSGTITVNGGMHTLLSSASSNFGAQNNSTMNFLGGTVTGVDLFRATTGASLTIGGDATLVGENASSSVAFTPGTVAFNPDWTGSLDLAGVSDWEATLIAAGATLDGTAITSASFATDFLVVGSNISLASIPEPSSLSLLGLSALFLAGRRTRK